MSDEAPTQTGFRLPQNTPLRDAITAWQPTADQSVHNRVTGLVTVDETHEILGRVTWTREGQSQKRVSVDATVTWQMAQKKGPKVTISATGEW